MNKITVLLIIHYKRFTAGHKPSRLTVWIYRLSGRAVQDKIWPAVIIGRTVRVQRALSGPLTQPMRVLRIMRPLLFLSSRGLCASRRVLPGLAATQPTALIRESFQMFQNTYGAVSLINNNYLYPFLSWVGTNTWKNCIRFCPYQ